MNFFLSGPTRIIKRSRKQKKSKYQVDLLLHAKMGNQSSDPSFQFEEAKPDGQN